jgi:hypothetical protein
MAFPVILVNSATGTDGICSGAGPATALAGVNNASSDGAGTTVTLPAGTDLSGVATDGSHVLYFADTTAGHRRFTTITGSAGSGGATPTVTVSPALSISIVNKTWAIGGKLATIGSTSSEVLFDNNGAAGDAMPGWAVEMESGHTETIGTTFDMRRSGDQTSGPITLRGASGAATRPVVTFSNNGNALLARGNWIIIRDFELQNSNATKTASVGIAGGSVSHVCAINMKIAHSTNKFWKAHTSAETGTLVITDCEYGFCANVGIGITGTGCRTIITNNWIHDCGSNGIAISGGSSIECVGNLFDTNAGDGIQHTGASSGTQANLLAYNTFYNNTGDGAEFNSAPGNGQSIGMTVLNNIFANNGGYGLNFSGASMSGAALTSVYSLFRGNNFFTNTSGKYNPSDLLSENETTADPQFTDAANGDFSIGTNLKATGYPLGGTLTIGAGSATYSYLDPGAAQRQEPTSSGTTAIEITSPIVISAGGRVGY